jgi:energy-converting hydrogenase Eha subunit H
MKRTIAIIILTLMASGTIIGSYLIDPTLFYSLIGIVSTFFVLYWCLENLR